MKLLTFVDLHGETKFLKKLVKRGKEDDIDLVVVAGDMTMFEDHLGYVLKKLNSIGKKVLLIPGNHESNKDLNKALKGYDNCQNFHEKAVEIEGYVFLGYGEGGFSLKDAEFRKVAREWYSKYQKKKIVLVTHAPPFGTTVDRVDRRHVGNKDIYSFIKRIKPKLVICGHIHDTAGKTDKIDGVNVINPGWEGMVVELG
ncbi:hypothetical protein GOV03_02080 [Candidatus Woesearchaeota archaeon]|nr:hypothetical protein [Candidatus Woesearchaeota archaeon]